MVVTNAKKAKDKIRKEPSKMGVKPKIVEAQEPNKMAYLAANLIDMELGFKAGIIIRPTREGGGYSDIFETLGSTLTGIEMDNPKTPERSIELLMRETHARKYGRRKQGSDQLRKLITLFDKLSRGEKVGRRDSYFHFRGKNAPDKAATAAALFKELGFQVKYETGKNGFSITGLPKDLKKGYASMRDMFLSKIKSRYEKLHKTPERLDSDQLVQEDKKPRRSGMTEAEKKQFEEDFWEDPRTLAPENGAKRILEIISKSMVSGIETEYLGILVHRKDVVETLQSYLPPTGKNPFLLFTPQEYRAYISFLRGERRGRTATRRTGKEHEELLAYHRKRGGETPRPWDAIMENTQRLMEGKKAVFIRSSYSSAAQTIATVEQMFPGRSVSYERSPESVVSGGGHWTITVAARGKRATPNIRWFQDNFGNQMRQGAASKDRRFTHAVRDSLAGGTSTVGFTNQNVPRWMSGMLDRKKSTQRTLVLKEEFWTKLQSKGIDVKRVIRGTPVYASERDKKKGREPKYYTFKLTLSGEKFSKHVEIARADVKKKYGPGRKGKRKPATAVARKGPAKELKKLKKKAQDLITKHKEKKKKKGPKKA